MTNENLSSILDVISGRESVKVSVGFDLVSSLYLAGALLLAGTILVIINKRLK